MGLIKTTIAMRFSEPEWWDEVLENHPPQSNWLLD